MRQLTAKQKKKAKASNHERALTKYIENLTTGRYASKRILTDIGMSAKTLKRLIAKAKDPSTDLRQTMISSGVEYVVEGSGQTQRAYFVKG